jgi:threonine 3-dehydrogenase
VVVPARNAWPVGGLAPKIAAAMEPFGNAVHACSKGDLDGRTVAIFGCGPIGCAAVAVAKAQGAAQIIALDRNDYRLALAEKMGATSLVQASADEAPAVRNAAGGDIDCALEMSGSPQAVLSAVHVVRPGGWISLLGIGDDPTTLDLASDVIDKGLTLYGIIGRRQFETWETTTRYITDGTVDVEALITHELPLDDIEAAMQLMKSGQSGKISLAIEQ